MGPVDLGFACPASSPLELSQLLRGLLPIWLAQPCFMLQPLVGLSSSELSPHWQPRPFPAPCLLVLTRRRRRLTRYPKAYRPAPRGAFARRGTSPSGSSVVATFTLTSTPSAESPRAVGLLSSSGVSVESAVDTCSCEHLSRRDAPGISPLSARGEACQHRASGLAALVGWRFRLGRSSSGEARDARASRSR